MPGHVVGTKSGVQHPVVGLDAFYIERLGVLAAGAKHISAIAVPDCEAKT